MMKREELCIDVKKDDTAEISAGMITAMEAVIAPIGMKNLYVLKSRLNTAGSKIKINAAARRNFAFMTLPP